MAILTYADSGKLTCSKCGHAVRPNTNSCDFCTNSWTPEDVQSASQEYEQHTGKAPSVQDDTAEISGAGAMLDPNLGFISNLVQGNYGLPTTYWLYGFVVGWVITIASFLIVLSTKSTGAAQLLIAVAIAYQIFISVAVFNAASKYKGSGLWKNLARVAIVLSALNTLRGCAQ